MDAKDIAEELQDTNEVVEQEEAETSESSTPEKMLSVSRVNELVKKAKRDGERKMQKQLEEAQRQIEELQGGQQQEQPAAAPVGNQQDPAAMQQQIMQMIEEKYKRDEKERYEKQLEQEVNQVAQQYLGKMTQGKDLYDDFESITADFNPAEFPQLVFLANQMDNTAAIIYELRKNPAKLASLASLVGQSPTIARNELAALSQSIKRNEEAKQGLQETPDPLSRLKPSQAGTDASGTNKSVRDLKKASYLRA